MPKRAVPEEKVPIAVPKQTRVLFVKGTCQHDLCLKEGWISFKFDLT